MSTTVSNWKGDVTYQAAVVRPVHSIGDVVEVVKDAERFPSPIRVKGSHHSTTHCVVAEGGTVLDMTDFDKILAVDASAMTITMQPGALLIDAAEYLASLGLQFYVNIELGNLTVGAGACAATKDASYASQLGREYGQVCSYCVGMKVVDANGCVHTIDESRTEVECEQMRALRSSYGLLGVVVEVKYLVKRLKPMAFYHRSYRVNAFARDFEGLIGQGRSMMMYLFPFLDRVVVEYRHDADCVTTPTSWQWRLRNWVWSTGSPGLGRIIRRVFPNPKLHNVLLNGYNWISILLLLLLRARATCPHHQIIRYADTASFASYTFSIWAFPRSCFGQVIRAYFDFSKAYFRKTGYRCELLNVGYLVAKDERSLFSYTGDGDRLTLDPVATGDAGWEEFLMCYNEFCSQQGGLPLFNQTPLLTHVQVQRAFQAEIARFEVIRGSWDPCDRFATPFFRDLFGTR